MAKKKKNNLLGFNDFYLNQPVVKKTILSQVRRNKSVLHGARALNRQMPQHLRVHTRDFDVFTKTPGKAARELERKLDKTFNNDFFSIQPGRTKGVIKVKNKITGRTTADFSNPSVVNPSTKILSRKDVDGVRIQTINQIENKLRKLISDPSKEFRRTKDLEALQRIRILKKLKGVDREL